MWRYFCGHKNRWTFSWYVLHFPKPTFMHEINFQILIRFCLDCVLYAVGKPVYFKSTEQNYGAWLRDALAKSDNIAERIWMTKENDGFQLFEYANKAAYRNNLASKVFRMQFPFKVGWNVETFMLRMNEMVYFYFQGNAHVVYNGCFYYFRRDEPKIVKYDLTSDKQAGKLKADFTACFYIAFLQMWIYFTSSTT